MVEKNAPKQQWKKCPNCESWIPEKWQRHEKCGWNIPEKTQIKASDVTNDIDTSISEFATIYGKCKEAIQDIYATKTLTPEHIAAVNTLFIQISKERYFKSKMGSASENNQDTTKSTPTERTSINYGRRSMTAKAS